jgi:DNA repair exonuclease SbcCD ATPase subunit
VLKPSWAWLGKSNQEPLDATVVNARLDRQHGRILRTENDLMRIGTQVAALEARMEDLREDLDLADLAADGQPGEDVRSIVEEVRREHERIRVRISAAARFEERLRQLEERLSRFEDDNPGVPS